MNTATRTLCYAAVALATGAAAFAQMKPLPTAPKLSPKAAAAPEEKKPTVIKANNMETDLVKQEAIFRGAVDVRDATFHMTSDTMHVTFNNAQNGVDRIVAFGNVRIEQVDKVATSGRMTYVVADKKIFLTETPKVVDKTGNTLEGDVIVFYRETNKVEVKGRTVLVLDNPNAVGTYSPKPEAPADKQPPALKP